MGYGGNDQNEKEFAHNAFDDYSGKRFGGSKIGLRSKGGFGGLHASESPNPTAFPSEPRQSHDLAPDLSGGGDPSGMGHALRGGGGSSPSSSPSGSFSSSPKIGAGPGRMALMVSRLKYGGRGQSGQGGFGGGSGFAGLGGGMKGAPMMGAGE